MGVENLLNKALLKFLPEAGGILLAYDNLQLVDRVGEVIYEGCETHFRIRCDALIFRLQRGTVLKGTVNKVSSNHIGLLVHGLFNASIGVDEMRYGMSFDEETGSWTCDHHHSTGSGDSSSDSNGNATTVTTTSCFRSGTQMLFEVTGVRSKAGLVAIVGSQKLSEPKLAKVAAVLEQQQTEEQKNNDASNSSVEDTPSAEDIKKEEEEEIEQDEDDEANDEVALTPAKKKKKTSTGKGKKKKTKNKKVKTEKKKKKKKKKKRKASDVDE